MFNQWQKSSYAKRHTVKKYTVQCYHLTSSDAEAVEVRLVDALAMSQKERDARIIFYTYKENSTKSFFERTMIKNI